jgi:hypothetical protein
MLPIADFLAGSLLTLLLPVALLIALTVWYVLFIRRVPETAEESDGTPASPPGSPVDAPAPTAEGP